MRYYLITGMSGAGKTVALRFFEDMGAFCVDNLPPAMIRTLMEVCETIPMRQSAAAFSVDVRSGALFNAREISLLLREGHDSGHRVETIFLEASDDALLSRFKETRRDHPLCGDGVTLTEAIAAERSLLQPLRESADHLVDTTALKSRGLQSRLRAIWQEGDSGAEPPLRVEVMSFGFKRGLPRQADLVLDVRFLPNPFYIPELSRHTGLDADVRDFVLGHPVTAAFLGKEEDILGFLLPHYREEGKKRLVLAVGCTGGAHRSVAIAEALAAWLTGQGCLVELSHRDLAAEQALWGKE